MARRIITAQEQHEMLAPWREAATVDDDYAHIPRDENGRMLLWRGVDEGGAHITYVNQPDPEMPHGNPFHFRPPASWDEVEQNHAIEDWENYGSWWGDEDDAKFYSGDSKLDRKHAPHGAMAVQAWFPRHQVHDSPEGHDGILVEQGAVGEIAQAHVYHKDKGWVPLHDAPGRTVTAASAPDPIRIVNQDDDWLAYHGDKPVGSLSVDYTTHVPSIDSVRVHPDYQRQGIARSLWEAAGRPAHTDDDMSEAGRAWARSVGGDRIGAVSRIAKHQPFDLLDDYYFPGYTYGAGEPDEHNPDLLDLQNAWLIGEGLQRRQPHMERGVVHGPAHPNAAMTDTERHLQNMGHEFTRRIHQSPGSEYPLYRGMVVPPDFIDRHSTGSTLRLPLSSFDGDPSLAWDYSTPVPEHHPHHAGKDGVLLHLPQGAKALHLVDAEHVTHGDYDVIRAHRATDQNRADLCGYGDQDAPCDCNAAPSTSDSHRPMILHLRQRSVPAPAQPRSASRRAFLEHIAQQI